MKSKVKYSKFSTILTLSILVLMAGLAGYTFGSDETAAFIILVAVLLILLVMSGFYAPLWIEAEGDQIIIKSPFKTHKLAIPDIASIELMQPTMGAIRICGSGGFMGYWGLFREADIGRYMAYYGRASDCFFIRMKNGDKYMLGCENPDEMVEYIKERMGQ